MDKSEQELKIKIAENLSDLSEQILKHQPPFNAFPIQDAVFSPLYLKYLQYFDELDKPLKENLINELSQLAKLSIHQALHLIERRKSKDTKSIDEFQSWITMKEGAYDPSKNFLAGSVIKATVLIKKYMQEKQAGFRYDRKQSATYGFPIYYKPCLDNNKIYIGLDRGTWRSFISVYIGMESPSFFMDIGELFNRSQSWYEYMITTRTEYDEVIKKAVIKFIEPLKEKHTQEELKALIHNSPEFGKICDATLKEETENKLLKQLDNIFELLDILLPLIIEKVQQAIEA
jgi:hypothetical protein